MIHEYVQYGCGHCAPEGWLNFDCSPTLRFERLPVIGRFYTKNARRFPLNVRYGDIVNGLPIPQASCSGIYCSHVLEHLALGDFDCALQNTFNCLKMGGVFRLVLPDLEQLARAYLGATDPLAALRFMKDARLGKEHRARGGLQFIGAWLGNSAHLWMWDEKAMRAYLVKHGFRDVRRAQFGDSGDMRFAEVEDARLFDQCLAMQCRK